MMPLAELILAGCLAVNPGSDWVVARDLTPGFPGLAAVNPETPLAPAPLAGAQRVFRVAELRRLALGLKVEASPEQDICVERKTSPLDPAKALEVLRRQLPQARIEIVEYSREPVPEGDLEFPLAGLRGTPADGFWSGWVRYAGGRRFPVWAKVKAVVSETRVVAAGALVPGRPIEAGQLRLETGEYFPQPGAMAASIEEVAGQVARVAVARGVAIRRQWLDPPREIARSDAVLVEAQVGRARVKVECVAEGPGSTGQFIPVRNPVSGKRFTARVEGKGRASVGKGDL
jgi:flagella basal body P-ring formation protein FlgA